MRVESSGWPRGWQMPGRRAAQNLQMPRIEFSIIGVSEIKIISGKEMDYNPSISGYVFEYVPTPLASHIDNFIV